jgi:23S rRNA (uracil1939-C5)-methyltransferase
MATSAELDISENVDASQRAVHISAASSPLDVRALRGLSTSEGLTGFAVSSGAHSARPVVVSGDPHVADTLTVEGQSVTLLRHVLSFFQGNRYLLQPLVAHVLGAIGRDEPLIDLYAGAGLFSVAAAVVRGARVTAVEGDRTSATDLAANARASGRPIVAVREPVEAFVARPHERPGVLIVDPPRTGMSKLALQGAIALGAATVVYVSCDVATLARDARRWLDAGYALATVQGFDLFPNTPHVETVAVFRRS